MRRIRELKPRVARLVPETATPRCEQEIVNESSRRYRQRVTPGDMRCQSSARYLIDGRHLCGKHAGMWAIAIMLGEK